MMFRDIAKNEREKFFIEFSEYHREWLRELVSKYKERGLFPVYPTQIIEYYPDRADKEIAVFAALCMHWNNGKELEQIASMRKLMGSHPYEWFRSREFVTISVGREQMNAIDGYACGHYWKIAKMYDMLQDICHDSLPSEVLKGKKFADFCNRLTEVCEITDMEYKRGVTELVLRTSDGIGRGLWITAPQKVKCPFTAKIKKYMRTWFPDFGSRMWTFDEAVGLFGLEHDYDFFYAWLAHDELSRMNPAACSRYATLYRQWWERRSLYPRYKWHGSIGIAPEIEF